MSDEELELIAGRIEAPLKMSVAQARALRDSIDARNYFPPEYVRETLLDGYFRINEQQITDGFHQTTEVLNDQVEGMAGGALLGTALGGVKAVKGKTGRTGGGTRSGSESLERYLEESGGRCGGRKTRHLNDTIVKILKEDGWEITHGAGVGPEEFFRVGSKGTYVDLRAIRNGKVLRVQTVTTTADGTRLTADEASAAKRIMEKFPNDELILINKSSSGPNIFPLPE